MPIQRHFLSANTPILQQAVLWLHEVYPPSGSTWDLHHLTIAVPGRRALRRLTELLVEHSSASGLLTPTLVTVGDLPEQLYEPDLPSASDLHANLAWIQAARQTPELTALLPRPPDADKLDLWWSLAGQFRSVLDDLAGARLTPAQVPDRCQTNGLFLPEPERWQALAAVTNRQDDILTNLGLSERRVARQAALERGELRSVGDVVLLGVLDVPPILAGMLRTLDTNVIALVHAEADLGNAFDDLGALEVDTWHDGHLDIGEDHVHAVERPFDQGRQAVACLADAAGQAGSHVSVEDITVGLGDEADVDAVRHALELAGLPTRYAAGRPVAAAAPISFLAALALLAENCRTRDLANLIRHPDVEDYLHAEGKDQTDWMAMLDGYAAEHLPHRIGDEWLGRHAQCLAFLWQCIEKLLPEAPMRIAPLPDWSEPIREALRRLYGHRTLAHDREKDADILRALERVAALLDEHQRLDTAHAITPTVAFAGAVDLLLSRLEGETLPEDGGVAAVELLGFLELPLDDAPVLVLTGLNEGRVPRVRGADPLLPDSLRHGLGLDDNRHRYAHAVCAMHSILRTRPTVYCITARWSSDRNPLAPSRLLLACDDNTRLRRLEEFYGTIGNAQATPAGPVLLLPGEQTHFVPPVPPIDDDTPVPDHLSVTAFRDYIACPYRFYLRRVLGLKAPDEPADEMDGALFGTLAHDVLEDFGRSDVAESKSPDEIAFFLWSALSDRAAAQFGAQLRPAIAIQIDQLRHRLQTFARLQAKETADGWRIHHVELKGKQEFPVDSQPFTLIGRVDRVDVHADGQIRVIDYKTSDTARTPQQAHRHRDEWIDLQLPLYRELIRPLELHEVPQLAYWNLPRCPEDAGVETAPWTLEEVEEAVEHARDLVRRVRNREFWPPGNPSRFPDEFGRLCADAALERKQLIELATARRGDTI